MRKSLCVGILRERRKGDRRAPLTPPDVGWLANRGIQVEVLSNPVRIFKDKDYKRRGAKIVNRFAEASLLVGVKEPFPEDIEQDKAYMIFSHTIKGQPQNMPLLLACLQKKVTLIEYEKIADTRGKRLVYFGRFAGICGIVDSLCYLGKKLEWQGIENPFSLLRPAYQYGTLPKVKRAVEKVASEIKEKRLSREVTPFIIGITGRGRVYRGVQEILQLLNPLEIHPEDLRKLVRRGKKPRNRIYTTVFFGEKKIRSRTGKRFYFEEYQQHPERFTSNMDMYLPLINVLIHTSYWDSRYPRLVTKKMINRLPRGRNFRIGFIVDIACDIDGSIELTYKTTSSEEATFTYDPDKRKYIDGFRAPGITIMAVDNLPAELPRGSSEEFSSLIREYVYQVASHGALDVTNHAAIPAEIRRGIIAQSGQLTKPFKYLNKFLRSSR